MVSERIILRLVMTIPKRLAPVAKEGMRTVETICVPHTCAAITRGTG